VVVDNPQLTARPDDREVVHQPLRIVLDSGGRISPDASVLQGASSTLVATTQRSDVGWRKAIEATGAEVLVLATADDGRVALRPLLEQLGRRGVLWLLVEGGGVVNGSFFDERLVDKVHAIIAPMIVGAAAASTPVAGYGAQRMADAPRLRDITLERLGEDVLVTGYPVWPEDAPTRL
jgi:diaminohydroxyphosphoribosylaminopyrimidine deaminase/5-amino-6-(5-phosphoribosylamino)uracil reductase